MKEKKEAPSALWEEELGFSQLPLCREPWESYFILRRGILPCSYGNPIIAPMTDWKEAWNSPDLRRIRRQLKRGKLPAYCLESLGCPIVQRYLTRKKRHSSGSISPPKKPVVFRFLNRLFLKIPGKIWHIVKEKKWDY